MKEITCYGQIKFSDHVQEWYETAAKTAGMRARELRNRGFRVSTSSFPGSITSMGAVNMTLLDAYGNVENLPEVKIERL